MMLQFEGPKDVCPDEELVGLLQDTSTVSRVCMRPASVGEGYSANLSPSWLRLVASLRRKLVSTKAEPQGGGENQSVKEQTTVLRLRQLIRPAAVWISQYPSGLFAR